MTKLPLCSSAQVCKALERAGCEPKPKRGSSHQAWTRIVDGRTLVAIVVLGKSEIPRGTLRGIIQQAGLTEDEFLRCLKGEQL